MSETKTNPWIGEVVMFFKNKPYIYFITIKPPRNDSKLNEVIDLGHKYFKKRCKAYWIVPSISENEYNHYHGIIQLDPEMTKDARERFIKAAQRYINRKIGFNMPFEMVQNLPRVCRYICRQRIEDSSDIHNITIAELDDI